MGGTVVMEKIAVEDVGVWIIDYNKTKLVCRQALQKCILVGGDVRIVGNFTPQCEWQVVMRLPRQQ